MSPALASPLSVCSVRPIETHTRTQRKHEEPLPCSHHPASCMHVTLRSCDRAPDVCVCVFACVRVCVCVYVYVCLCVCHTGNLLELLEAQPGGMDREAVRLILYQLCTAIAFIHSKVRTLTRRRHAPTVLHNDSSILRYANHACLNHAKQLCVLGMHSQYCITQ